MLLTYAAGLISALGEYVTHLPDYQKIGKIKVITFINLFSITFDYMHISF